MLRICFVCLGNICRSPMAEFIMKEKVREKHLEKEILISSRATSYEEEGSDIYPPVKKVLESNNIPYTLHHSTRLEKSDLNKFDLFIGMDDNNLKGMKYILEDDSKSRKLLNKDILDPWYTRDFNTAYKEISHGIDLLLEELIKSSKYK